MASGVSSHGFFPSRPLAMAAAIRNLGNADAAFVVADAILHKKLQTAASSTKSTSAQRQASSPGRASKVQNARRR